MTNHMLNNVSLKTLLLLLVLAFGFAQTKPLGEVGFYKPFDEAHGDKFSLGDFDNPYLIQVTRKYRRYSEEFSSISIGGENYDVNKTQYQKKVYLGIADMSLTEWKALPRKSIPVTLQLVLAKSDGSREAKSFDLTPLFKGVTRTGAGEIYSWRDLQNVEHDLAGNYLQMNDITFPKPRTRGFPQNGFKPIGYFNDYQDNDYFTGSFDGGGWKIKNLFLRSSKASVGLFAAIGGEAQLKNIALIDNYVENIGDNKFNRTGGLVGILYKGGSIIASHTTGRTVGGYHGLYNRTGGLVGYQSEGSITASYATGSVIGGNGKSSDQTGGLVGYQYKGSIMASYATGYVNAGDGGKYNSAGGLVGLSWFDGSITNSYATGSVTGGSTHSSYIGGLVGNRTGSITASYATGRVSGRDGGVNSTGGLVGNGTQYGVTASYGFSLGNGEGIDRSKDANPSVTKAKEITKSNSSSIKENQWSSEVWDFGNENQRPILKYADYDGRGGVDYCSLFKD